MVYSATLNPSTPRIGATFLSSAVVLAAVRTPYGRLLGSLSAFSGPELGALALAEAIRRAGLAPEEIRGVYLGNVAAHALRGNPAAAAWAETGRASRATCVTVRSGCASGLLAIEMAVRSAVQGEEPALAGGFESASDAPHLAQGLRRGLRLGSGSLLDAARHDGPAAVPLGGESDREAYLQAFDNGLLADEIAPVEIPATRKKEACILSRDDAADPPERSRAGPRPALADGAAALVIASEAWSRDRGIEPIARITHVGVPDTGELAGSRYIEADLPADLAGALLDGGDRVSSERVNVRGGGALLGHATGADGARLAVSLVHLLRQNGGGAGFAVAGGAWGEAAGAHLEV
jgi:acetyl-CoA C-acetyltransferase